jgi:Flp pilus assembly protein TadG
MRRVRFIADSEGQSLLELAFVLPVLVLLLFGAAEFGRLCYIGIEVTNAAHAAATYGSQNRGTASDNSGITVAATSEGSNLTNLQVTPQHLCADTYNQTPTRCTTAASALEYVQVNTQVTVASLFGAYGFGGNYTLHGTALEMVRQ